MRTNNKRTSNIVEWLEQNTLPERVHALLEPIFVACMRRNSDQSGISKARKILVVQPDLIGDLLLLSPFLRELRRFFPQSWISLVVEPNAFNLVEHCPYVDEIFLYDCKNWSLYWRWKFFVTGALLSVRHLLSRNFDLAIFPHWEIDHYYGTMLAYLSGAKYRISYSESTTAEKRLVNKNYNLLLTHALEDSTVRHEVEQSLSILRALGLKPESGQLEVWLTEEDKQFSTRLLSETNAFEKPLIAVCVGGSHRRKRWPVERYLEVCRYLVSEYGANLLLVGSASDSAAASQIAKELRSAVIDVCGKTTLRQTAALLQNCRLYVGNDTAPMHMSAALSVPVLAVSCHPVDGSTERSYSPVRFGPWQVDSIVLQPAVAARSCLQPDPDRDGQLICDYCIDSEAHCILGVQVPDVIEAVDRLLLHMRGAKGEQVKAVSHDLPVACTAQFEFERSS
jgi:ADP-heptose:LPS heptosyltransferase